MKTSLLLLLAALLVGCATQRAPVAAKSDGDCCGLTIAQWQAYDEKAADAVANPAAWAKIGVRMPMGVHPTSHSNLFGTTNSPDGERPPTEVTIHVPIGYSVPGCSIVVVEFRHPEGKIKAMNATDVLYD